MEPGEDAAEEVEIFNGGGVAGVQFLDQLGFVQFRGVQRVYADFPFQWLELQQFAVDGAAEGEHVEVVPRRFFSGCGVKQNDVAVVYACANHAGSGDPECVQFGVPEGGEGAERFDIAVNDVLILPFLTGTAGHPLPQDGDSCG